MKIREITSQESQKQNLDAWCYEVGTRFQHMSVEAAKEFANYISHVDPKEKLNWSHIIDLGSGDGAGTNALIDSGFDVTAVDINRHKLERNTGANLAQKNILEYVTDASFLPHIFTHHSLEHTVDAPEIIQNIGIKMNEGYFYYATVPAEDYLHSVHHVVFESPEELLPPRCEPILLEQRTRYDGENNAEKEFVCLARKK